MLSAGARVGPYEIVSLLGAGGMGEVYRARDSRLAREVALKVLHPSVASDADRLRRFELEAKAVGALNHPNVLAVFDVGTENGQPYVVAELLEGETLRNRLDGVVLPLRKALDYAGQIARGLAAAHDKGIVHRDLKPENLFVTKDGRLKILDFGLAKLTRPEDPSSGAATISRDEPGTSPGAILGTVGYMSPEQVRGVAADQRADIFAFGAILYEMLSGRRAFRGETTADTFHAILREETPELAGINRSVPPGLERIVRHCLEKSPDERFQSARDLAFNLEALSETSGVSPANGGAPRGPTLPRRRLLRVIAVPVIALALGTLLDRATRAVPPPPSFQRMTFRQGRLASARFGPDGQTVVYSASWQGGPMEVFLSRAGSHEARALGLPEARVLSLSSAGELALLLSPRLLTRDAHLGTLARVALAGGLPREMQEDVQDADWSPDGKDLAIIRWADEKCRLEFPVGRVVYAPAPPTWLSDVRVSPRGDRIAFLEHPVEGDWRGCVAAVDLAGKKRMLDDGFSEATGLAWSPAGDEVWFSGSRQGSSPPILAVSLSGNERVLSHAPGGLCILDVSRSGRALIRRLYKRNMMLAVRPGEARERDLSELDDSDVLDISKDGRMLVGGDVGEASGSHEAVFLKRTDGSPAVWLGEGRPLALSPDEKQILVRRVHTSPQRLMLMPTGAGQAQELPGGEVERYLEGKWFPDGRKILFAGSEGGHGSRLYVQNLDGGAPRSVSPEGYTLPLLGATISADGRRTIALAADLAPVLYPLEGGEPTPIPGLAPGDVPIGWTEDGKGLFFYNVDDGTAVVRRADLRTGRTSVFRQLLPAPPVDKYGHYKILATPNGRSFAYSYTRDLSDLYLVNGLR